MRICICRKIADKEGNIDVRHFSPVLRAQLHGGIVRYHIFPSVAGDMVVDAPLQRFQQRGFAVIASSGDQGDPAGDSHPAHFTRVGKTERDGQRFRRPEGHCLFHRPVGDAALTGKHRPVGDKGRQTSFLQLPADLLLVLAQLDRLFQISLAGGPVKQGILHSRRNQVKEDLLQLPGIDCTAVCRKTDLEAHNDFLIRNLAGRPLQKFLPRTAHGKQAALPGSFRLKAGLGSLPAKSPQQKVLQGGSLSFLPVIVLRKCGAVQRHMDTETGGSSEGISLNMLNHQLKARKMPAPGSRLIGRITLMVYLAQKPAQLLRVLHSTDITL